MDLHVAHAVADGLRRRGIDVIRAQDVGKADASDDEHLEYAYLTKRVVVSQDKGFIARVRRNEPNYGVAYCAQGSRSIGEMIAALVRIYDEMDMERMTGQVRYL